MTIKTEPRLGEFELLVVLSMIQVGDSAYGAALAREIEKRTDRDVSLGAIYKTLERLEAKSYLTSRIGEPRAERGGRRRKHYRLTSSGHRTLVRTLEDLDSMRQGLATPIGVAGAL